MSYCFFYVASTISITLVTRDACKTSDTSAIQDTFHQPLSTDFKVRKKGIQEDTADSQQPEFETRQEIAETKTQPRHDDTKEKKMQLGYPNGKTVHTGDIDFDWHLGELAEKVRIVELHGSVKNGDPFVCTRIREDGDDCTGCRVEGLGTGKYDFHVEATVYDGAKYGSGPGRFVIMPSIIETANLPISVQPVKLPMDAAGSTVWIEEPKDEDDTYKVGTKVQFVWNLGEVADKIVEVRFHLKAHNSEAADPVILDCKVKDCTRYACTVSEEGAHDWMIEAFEEDDTVHYSNEGSFRMLP